MNSLLVLFLSLAVPAAHASPPISYECQSDSGSGTDQEIQIRGASLVVSSLDRLNGMRFKATLDESYHPRGNAKKVRFKGSEDGNSREVILSESMLESSAHGFMQIRGHEDGYWSAEYGCVLK